MASLLQLVQSYFAFYMHLHSCHLLHNLHVMQKIYIGETGKRLADRFREHLREKKTKNQNMRPNQSRAILIFPITPTTT